MKKHNNVIAIIDPAEDIEAMARLTWTPIDPYDDIEAMARLTWMPMEKRRAGHRREKRIRKLDRLLNVLIVLEAIALVLVIMWNL